MRILVLGGTRLIGKSFVPLALARGHEVTLFNRGTSDPSAFDGVEQIHGDRDGGLAGLKGREWDGVLDTSGYVPRVVRMSAELLEGAGHYTFISSESVYADDATPGQDESGPVSILEDPTAEEVNDRTYGGLKVLCEDEVRRVFGDRCLIVRAGLIVGPNDYTDRFTYWVRRLATGGEVLAPAPPGAPVQLIDARDLAEWLLLMSETRGSGTTNVTGPLDPLAMETVLETCHRVAGSDARITWVDPGFLVDEGVEPWTEVPLWIPGEDAAGFMTRDVSAAVAAGLRFRPLAETVRDTLEWDATRRRDEPLKAGLAAQREAEPLAEWLRRDHP